jgi:hypothetical protein
MAKCSEKEREYLDSMFTNNLGLDDIELVVLRERIPTKLKSDLKQAVNSFHSAKNILEKVRSEFYSICADNRMAEIVKHLESEAL